MEKFRFSKLGIEIEIPDKTDLEVKETRNCIRISYKNKRIVTVLPDSKIEFLDDIDHVICYKGRVVAFGSVHVEVGGASRIFAKDKTCVIAHQSAEIRANGRAKVWAFDNSRVIAGGRAAVYLDGESKCYKKNRSRVKMNKFSDRAVIIDII